MDDIFVSEEWTMYLLDHATDDERALIVEKLVEFRKSLKTAEPVPFNNIPDVYLVVAGDWQIFCQLRARGKYVVVGAKKGLD